MTNKQFNSLLRKHFVEPLSFDRAQFFLTLAKTECNDEYERSKTINIYRLLECIVLGCPADKLKDSTTCAIH